MKVKDIMKKTKTSSSDISIKEDESIDNACSLIKEHNLEKLTVVDKKNNIVGVITKDCLINASEDINEDFFLD